MKMGRAKSKNKKPGYKHHPRTLINKKEKCTNCGVPVPKEKFKCVDCEQLFEHDYYYRSMWL